MKRFLSFVVALLLAATASGQIKTSTTEKLALSGVTSPIVQGDRILVGADSKLAASPVVILQVETDYKFKRIKASKDGQRTQPEPISDTQFLFAGKGKYLVEITVFDPERGIDETEVKFEIGASPDKPDDVDPKPEPSGPFENLAIRVALVAIKLTPEQRSKWIATLETVVAKMDSLQFRRVDEARNFIRAAGLSGSELSKLLEDDAKTRLLSFAETVSWYREVLKGLK